MKIAFVSTMAGFPWGGSEDLWYKTALSALERGHSISTFTKRWEILPSKIKSLQVQGVNTYFYDSLLSSFPNLTIKQRIANKFRYSKKNNDLPLDSSADCFIISNGGTFDFIYMVQLCTQIISYNKPFVLISQHNAESGGIINNRYRNFGIDVINKAKKFFFVSKRNRFTAERQIGIFLENATLISNPINIKDEGIKDFPISECLTIACVARLDCSYKGQDILLQTLGEPQWKNRDFRLKFYGDGPDKEHIQRLIQLYNLDGKVNIEGHVNDIDEIWTKHQILILPSLSEGTPLSLMEAMLSGRPALVTDVGDCGEFIIDGYNGFLAPTASKSCLSKSLEDLWDRQADLKTMGENAFNTAKKLIDLYPNRTLLSFIESLK